MVFWGVIMGLFEKRYCIWAAVIVPSFLFGLLHVFSNGIFSPLEKAQLVLAGTVAGILFSLIEYYYDSSWNNTLVHAFLNASVIGGIIRIDTEPHKNAAYTYVLKSKSPLITGGTFGTETSAISIAAYSLFIGMLVLMLRKKKQADKRENWQINQ